MVLRNARRLVAWPCPVPVESRNCQLDRARFQPPHQARGGGFNPELRFRALPQKDARFEQHAHHLSLGRVDVTYCKYGTHTCGRHCRLHTHAARVGLGPLLASQDMSKLGSSQTFLAKQAAAQALPAACVTKLVDANSITTVEVTKPLFAGEK